MRWIQRPEILYYLIECYAGTEEKDTDKVGFKTRRVFIWEAQGEIRMGNVEAFAEHLREHFSLVHTRGSITTQIHHTLSELGEKVRTDPKHSPPQAFGVSHRPEPEYTVLRKADAQPDPTGDTDAPAAG